MIDALPDPESVTVENMADLERQINDITAAMEELTNEEQNTLDLERLNSAAEAWYALQGEKQPDVSLLAGEGLSSTPQIKLGDYVYMGTYNGSPILWRCVAFEKITGNDANGNPIMDSTQTSQTYQDGYLPLMLADGSLCDKQFDKECRENRTGSHARDNDNNRRKNYGSNYWGDSNIRDWLNSSADTVTYTCGNSPSYASEPGFLTNFNDTAKAALKTVVQKSLLADPDKDISGATGSEAHTYNTAVANVVQNYNTTAYSEKITDTMFLLDVQQVHNVYANWGDYYKLASDYWLRSPYFAFTYKVRCISSLGDVGIRDANNDKGVRPAFYLNPSSSFVCGTGTKEKPFTVGSHSLAKQAAVAATCTEDGHGEYWVCSVCGKMFSDGNGTTAINSIPTISKTGHSYSTSWSKDADNHWHECAKCGDKKDSAAHSWNSGEITTAATCTTDGAKKYTCTVCSQTKTETVTQTGHSYQYTASGGVITGTCQNNTAHTVTATLTAQDATYDGTAKATGNVAYSDGWTGGELAVSYQNNTNAGTATASITCGDATASVNFQISKAAPTATAPTAKTGLIYNGSAQELINAGSTTGGTVQYSTDGTNYSATVPTGTNAGSYTVHYKVVGGDNYNDVAADSVPVTIARKTITGSVTISGTASMNETLTAKYSESGETISYQWYRGDDEISGATGSTYILVADDVGKTIKVKASGTGNYTGNATSDPTATVAKATITVTAWPTATAITYGQSLNDSTLTGGAASVNGSFAWTDGSAKPTASDSGTTKYRVTFTPSGAGYDAVTGEITLTVNKATLTPSATANDKTYDGSTSATGSITLTGAVNGEAPAAIGTFAFADANVGTGKTVNVTSIALTGDWGNNYQLSATMLTATADITVKSISGATITLGESLTYTGQDQTQVVTKVEIDGLEATYTVSDNKRTNAGTYTLTVAGSGNFNGTQTQDFTIAKANNKIIGLSCADVVFGGTPSPSASATFGTPSFTYSSDKSVYGAWNAANHKGVWYVKATVDETDNYDGATSEVSFNVTAEQEPTPNAAISYNTGSLTALTAGAGYSITSSGGAAISVNAETGGTITIQSAWFGKTISIIKTARNEDYSDSKVQNLSIPARPATPDVLLKLTKTANSITVTSTYAGCEFSIDGAAWNDTGNFTGLTEGTEYTVRIRIKATASSFNSEAKTQAVTTIAADGSTSLKPGESVTTDGTTITNTGGTITVEKGGTTTTISQPSGGGSVDVGGNGNVTVPGGSTVKPQGGPEITMGDKGGTVGGNGEISVPGGGSVTVPDGKGGQTTITVPESGGTVKPTGDGKVEVPGGSTVKPQGGPEITMGDKGGTIGSNGEISVPGGGSVTVPDGKGGQTTITVPEGGGTVKPTGNGEVEVPGGSTVKPDGGTPIIIPGGGGSVAPGGEVEYPVTVTFDSQGGSAVSAQTIVAGGKITKPTNPVKSGYTFGGWYQDATCTTVWDFSMAVTSSITLYAKWAMEQNPPAPITYTVTFDAQGGSPVSSQTVIAGGKITRPVNPVKSGYVFGGWYKESTCDTVWSFDSDAVANDVTLYAKWMVKSSGGNSSGGGGGHTTPTYPPTVEKPSEGGSVSVVPGRPSMGDKVTIRPKPDTGYEVDQVIVTDRGGKPVAVTENSDGTYTFTQPDGKVKIEVSYQPIDPPWVNPYSDISEKAWYIDAVRFVSINGLMNGYENGQFGPNDNLSRAQLAQILYNHAGRPAVTGASPFTDVADGAWYTNAITWAAAQGIVGGYGNGLFGPNDNITREQLAVMLWRYAGSPAATNKELHFTDADEAGDFALEALRWAVEHGILNGYGDGRLNPAGQATRAQTAAMLMRYMIDTQE